MSTTEKKYENTNPWKLNNTLINNQYFTEEMKKHMYRNK